MHENINKKRNFSPRCQAGTTFIELIIVLSIFALITSVSLFDYKKFQAKVDIKNLANDIALKFVEVQKFALSGKWSFSPAPTVNPWRPSYGLYFDTSSNVSFRSFVDLDQDKNYDNGESTELFNITKGNTISEIGVYNTSGNLTSVSTDLHITFTRPNSGADIRSGTSLPPDVFYAQVKITSPEGITSCVKMYASGRIQINSCT